MSGPRILAIMGSGETAPTMAKVHRALFERLDAGGAAGGVGGSASGGAPRPAPVPAAILDTPYGFQENADELSARTVEFFGTSVGRPAVVASYRSREVDALTLATAVARIREARYVMAGPGSPSYALRQWAGGPIPDALAAKLADGGILTMASAAALTVGVVTIPVYEIYKVGEAPRWLEGLDLVGRATGLRAAVVPHYDNAEGGTHDTRFCYMGERRLCMLEAALPEGAFILGVDSHTALVLDLEAGTACGLRPRRGHRPGRRPERRLRERQPGAHRGPRRGRPGPRRGPGGRRRHCVRRRAAGCRGRPLRAGRRPASRHDGRAGGRVP